MKQSTMNQTDKLEDRQEDEIESKDYWNTVNKTYHTPYRAYKL